MARPLDENRRTALLDAATRVFAEHGLAAPTALISKTAGVSEGSFFTYFKTKDELINALYRELRLDLAAAVMTGYPRKGTLRQRLEHVWNGYVGWGVANPVAKKALRLTAMAPMVSDAVRAESSAPFAEVDRLQEDALAQRMLKIPPLMASATLKALADMTMDLVARSPEQADELIPAGFRMLWAALTAKE